MSSSVPIAQHNKLWRDINWFAVHTKPRREKFAFTNVNACGVESFLPMLKVERWVQAGARTIVKPLFPGYFFARFRPEDSLESVECSRGVLQVVSSGRLPVPVQEGIIREIQDGAGEDGVIRLRQKYFKSGDRISVQGGPFEGMMGRVERELDDGKRVAILLETLWHCRVLIERRWLDGVAA